MKKKWKKVTNYCKKGTKSEKKEKRKKERTKKKWQISKGYTKLCTEHYFLRKITHSCQKQV